MRLRCQSEQSTSRTTPGGPGDILKLDSEQLFDAPNGANDIGRSRRNLFLMLVLAALALQALTGCGGSGGNGGGSANPSTLTLSPQNPQAVPGQTITFTVTAPTGVTGTVEYDWTQTSTFAT